MKEFWTMTRVCFSAIGGWLGYFLGGCDNLMIALIVFVVADYVTGVMCAIIDKKLSSEVGFKGIFKKVLIFILVGIAHILDGLYEFSYRSRLYDCAILCQRSWSCIHLCIFCLQ